MKYIQFLKNENQCIIQCSEVKIGILCQIKNLQRSIASGFGKTYVSQIASEFMLARLRLDSFHYI